MSALAYWQQLTVRAAENPCTLPAAFLAHASAMVQYGPNEVIQIEIEDFLHGPIIAAIEYSAILLP
jgi:hypothetical protein